MREPGFWWRSDAAAARLLAPAAAAYGFVAARRMAQPGWRAGVPVLCIGNFTVGGSGKTPTAIAVARLLTEAGRRPFFLSRGYGGSLAGPVRVDAQGCRGVGDEPLLLARVAPTIVARDRPAGARAAIAAGAEAIVMDDGWQNPSLAKDLVVAVLDGRRGIGNGRVFPAGPLRAPLASQLDHADAVLVIGPPGHAAAAAIAAAEQRRLPRLCRRSRSRSGPCRRGLPARVCSHSQGSPIRTSSSRRSRRAASPSRRVARFPDHHRYTADEIARLIADADTQRLTLVTTEKDWRGSRAIPPLTTLRHARRAAGDLKVGGDAFARMVIDAAAAAT